MHTLETRMMVNEPFSKGFFVASFCSLVTLAVNCRPTESPYVSDGADVTSERVTGERSPS